MNKTLKIALFTVVLVASLLLFTNVSKAATKEVGTEADLRSALADSSVTEITLTDDITMNAPIEVNHTVTINGDNNDLIGSDEWKTKVENKELTGNQTILTSTAGTLTLQNMSISNSPKYGVQAFNGSVVLSNVSISDCGFGGVLVNGGTVTVKYLYLGYNGAEANNGIEIDQGTSTGTPKLVMDGSITTSQSENVVRTADNANLKSFIVENTEDSSYKVVIADRQLTLKNSLNQVVSQSAITAGVTADVDQDSDIVLTILTEDNQVVELALEPGTTVSKDYISKFVSVPSGMVVGTIYNSDQAYYEFDFSQPLNSDAMAYVTFTKAVDEDNTPVDDEEKNEEDKTSEEEAKSEEEKDETPKTGIASYLAIALGVAVISTVGVVYLRKRNA